MSLGKKVTHRWALEKLSAMKQIDTLPFVKQDLFKLSLDDIASWLQMQDVKRAMITTLNPTKNYLISYSF